MKSAHTAHIADRLRIAIARAAGSERIAEAALHQAFLAKVKVKAAKRAFKKAKKAAKEAAKVASKHQEEAEEWRKKAAKARTKAAKRKRRIRTPEVTAQKAAAQRGLPPLRKEPAPAPLPTSLSSIIAPPAQSSPAPA